MLFEPLHLKRLTLKNRIVVSPMCQYSSIDGFASNWHLVHLGQFAIGQAAVIIQEATAVSPEGRISYGDLGIWKEEHIEKLQEITTFIKEQNCIPGLQLAHAGRKASTDKPWLSRQQIAADHEHGWQTYSSSAIPFHEGDQPPLALSIEEIQQVITDFRQAARRAVKAGYDILEIHAAHGYLIHQFMSPLINDRTDDYGGSFDNRIRFLLEIVAAVKQEISEQSLWVRVSGTDWAEGGWTLEETVKLSQILKEQGVEVMDISSGGAVVHQKIDPKPNYQVFLAEEVKKQANTITGAVGIITSGKQAEALLQEQKADLILVGRAFLADPHFPLRAAHELGVQVEWPVQYERAKSAF